MQNTEMNEIKKTRKCKIQQKYTDQWCHRDYKKKAKLRQKHKQGS